MIQVIRSHCGNLQDLVGAYLEQSLKQFTSHQAQVRERVNALAGPDPGMQRPPPALRMRELGRDLAREMGRDIDKDRVEPK